MCTPHPRFVSTYLAFLALLTAMEMLEQNGFLIFSTKQEFGKKNNNTYKAVFSNTLKLPI
jgi:hypothetical protein